MTDSSTADPLVPIYCPECETETRVPLETLEETLTRHNEQLHDGEQCARVDPAVVASLTDIVATEMGLLERE